MSDETRDMVSVRDAKGGVYPVVPGSVGANADWWDKAFPDDAPHSPIYAPELETKWDSTSPS